MQRARFAGAFLQALGAAEVRFDKVTDSFVQGTVVYDPTDPDKRQEFRWRITEEEVPGDDVLKLVELLRDETLLHSDKLRLSRQQLREKFQSILRKDVSEAEFSDILDRLESVQIPMLDDGREGGDYFLFTNET